MIDTVKFGAGITLGGGIKVGTPGPAPTLMLNLDAATYTSGPWVDTVSSREFILNNGVTYSTNGGGSLVFNAASAQYAECTSSLSSLSTWSVEAWHYYTGTNTGGSPQIVSESFAGGKINYLIGSWGVDNPLVSTGFFDGAFNHTDPGYSLTAGNWYQIVGTYDGTTLKLYVNNVLVETGTISGISESGNSGIRLMIRWDGFSECWGGSLGIVKIYNGDIGASGVAASWNSNKARFGFSSLTIATNDGGGLTGWGSTALAVVYDPVIISDYTVGSTITFYDNTTATITGIDNYGPIYIDIFWDTPKTGTLFPITLSN